MKITCLCKHCSKHTNKTRLKRVRCFKPEIISMTDVSYQPKTGLWFDKKVIYAGEITNQQKEEIIKHIQDKPDEILRNCCFAQLDTMTGDCEDAMLFPFFWKKYVISIVCKNTDINLET